MTRTIAAMLVTLHVSCRAFAAQPVPEVVTGGLDNVIPTPHYIQAKPGELVLVQGRQARAVIVVAGNATRRERMAAQHLRGRVQLISGVELPIVQALEGPEETVAIVIGSLNRKTMPDEFLASLPADDRSFLHRAEGTDQDYVIDCTTVAGRPTAVLCGGAPQGALYATMMLIHALSKADERVVAPRVHIRDYPDVPFRWLSSCGGSSPEARIDSSMEHKVNLLKAFQYYHFTFKEPAEQLRRHPDDGRRAFLRGGQQRGSGAHCDVLGRGALQQLRRADEDSWQLILDSGPEHEDMFPRGPQLGLRPYAPRRGPGRLLRRKHEGHFPAGQHVRQRAVRLPVASPWRSRQSGRTREAAASDPMLAGRSEPRAVERESVLAGEPHGRGCQGAVGPTTRRNRRLRKWSQEQMNVETIEEAPTWAREARILFALHGDIPHLSRARNEFGAI